MRKFSLRKFSYKENTQKLAGIGKKLYICGKIWH